MVPTTTVIIRTYDTNKWAIQLAFHTKVGTLIDLELLPIIAERIMGKLFKTMN